MMQASLGQHGGEDAAVHPASSYLPFRHRFFLFVHTPAVTVRDRLMSS